MTTTTTSTLRDGTWTVLPGRAATFRVRNFFVLPVRGTLAIEAGTVTVTGGIPVTAEGILDAATISTGVSKRDEHLRTEQFLDATAHPRIRLRAVRFEPVAGGWSVPALLTVGGVEAPITLHARLGEVTAAAATVHLHGELDRTATRIRAPRFMVGHRVRIEAALTFSRQ
jgi:polyisoprenoid-binding protein YceI